MSEPTNYLVVCSCTGEIDPVAFIEDHRAVAAGGGLVIASAKPGMKQIVSAVGYHPEIENWRAPDGFAAGTWADYNVTETVLDWDTMRRWWIVRCLKCHTQAQVSDANLRRIVDKFDGGDWGSLPSLKPGERVVQSWDPTGWARTEVAASDEWQPSRIVKLGVLRDEAQGSM